MLHGTGIGARKHQRGSKDSGNGQWRCLPT
jgi:hypothetical protein